MKDLIIQNGDPILRATAIPVPKKDFGTTQLKKIITKMKQALHKETYGVAIAAPQIGESLRIFVVAGKMFVPEVEEGTTLPPPDDRVFINPTLTRLSRKKREMSEGCLSVRGKYGTVIRHVKASVNAYDENGKAFVYHGADIIAHIFQHEVEHLEGILYTDKAEKLREEDERDTLREDYPA